MNTFSLVVLAILAVAIAAIIPVSPDMRSPFSPAVRNEYQGQTVGPSDKTYLFRLVGDNGVCLTLGIPASDMQQALGKAGKVCKNCYVQDLSAYRAMLGPSSFDNVIARADPDCPSK